MAGKVSALPYSTDVYAGRILYDAMASDGNVSAQHYEITKKNVHVGTTSHNQLILNSLTCHARRAGCHGE